MSFTAQDWKLDYDQVKGQVIQVRGEGASDRMVSFHMLQGPKLHDHETLVIVACAKLLVGSC